MCAEKNNESGCCESFSKIIKECCSGGDVTDFCARMKEACGSGCDDKTDCMTAFRQMKDKFCGSEKAQGCCG